MRDYTTAAEAIADFKKKFKDKSKNDWDKRNKFIPVPGKYTLLEMDEDDEVGITAFLTPPPPRPPPSQTS